MHTNNIFTQKDPVADLVSQIAEADYKTKMEELKGNQKVLDKNKNNKLDADDFKILRGEKKAVKEEEEVEESSNPFSPDYKSQIPTKPGEKAGFDSKKTSTGTVYTKKHKKDPDDMKKEEVEQVDEASYSAKAARAGKDIGKPGKMFKKIAKKAAARYGSTEKGKKVAGAVLAKLRKEETDFEPLLINQIVEDTMSAIEQLDELSKNLVNRYLDAAKKKQHTDLNNMKWPTARTIDRPSVRGLAYKKLHGGAKVMATEDLQSEASINKTTGMVATPTPNSPSSAQRMTQALEKYKQKQAATNPSVKK